MVELNAPLRAKLRPSLVMPLLAGLTLETGQSAHCHAEALELKQGQSLASSPRMADFHAPLRTPRKRTKTVMLPLAGLTSETGQNVPCPVVALEVKQGQSLASSPRMADFHALPRTLKRRTRTAMPLLAGQSSVPGLHAKVCAEALVLKPGPGHALSHLRVDCHAQLNLQSLRTRNVTQLVSGQLLPLKGYHI